MPPSLALPVHRLIFASIVATAAGAVACTWSLGYLDDRGDAGPSGSSSAISSSSSSTSASSSSTSASSSSTSASSSSSSAGPYLGDGGNLVVNPSCEDGILNWTTLGGNSELEVSTTVVHTGDTASCRAYDRMDEESPPALTSYDGPAQDVTDVVVPGHSYTVNAWALWEPPPSPDAGSPGDAVDAGDDDASAGSSDAAVDAGMSVDAAVDAGFGPQSVYITAKVTCTQNGVQNVAYDRLAIASPVPEATWMPVPDSTLLMVPTGCSGLDVQLYVEGPDIGLDLYTDEVTLLLFQ